METKTTQAQIWARYPSTTRAGKYFFTARSNSGSVVTVSQHWISKRWIARDGERELFATHATATEAKRYAEFSLGFGRAL